MEKIKNSVTKKAVEDNLTLGQPTKIVLNNGYQYDFKPTTEFLPLSEAHTAYHCLGKATLLIGGKRSSVSLEADLVVRNVELPNEWAEINLLS